MTALKRKIYTQLLQWKQESAGRTALLIDGARRVGKSYTAEEFARENYRSHITIDFNIAPKEVKDLFANSLHDLDSFFLYLSAIYNVELHDHDSLIILDEIQMFPRARAAIKYLVADGRYHYIETGSLISIRENVKDILIPSEERHVRMYPLDFEEFLWAMNEEPMLGILKKNYQEKKEMGPALHRKAMTLFRQYLIVGGMPQAVQVYLETRSFAAADRIKRDILTLYRTDITRLAHGYKHKVEAVFDEIPEQLAKHGKKFSLASLGNGARYRSYESSFLWLEDSMICNICYCATAPDMGLRLNRDRNTMKIYLGDTGLLLSLTFDDDAISTEEVYKKLLTGKLEMNEGMFFENIVAQMLTASGHRLYFYASPSKAAPNDRMAIDFLLTRKNIQSRHNVSPLEVKSGKRYTYTSLRKFVTKYHEQLGTAYILHTADYMEKDGFHFIPVYWTWLL